MSKLRLNHNLDKYLTGGVAFALASVMIASGFVVSGFKKKYDENNSKQVVYSTMENENERNQQLKKHIEENINNLQIIIDNDNISYYITEMVYIETPIYGTNDKGNSYVKGYTKEPGHYKNYTISFEKAKELGIDELLESNAFGSGSMIR